jgi:hypothetical protein
MKRTFGCFAARPVIKKYNADEGEFKHVDKETFSGNHNIAWIS